MGVGSSPHLSRSASLPHTSAVLLQRPPNSTAAVTAREEQCREGRRPNCWFVGFCSCGSDRHARRGKSRVSEVWVTAASSPCPDSSRRERGAAPRRKSEPCSGYRRGSCSAVGHEGQKKPFDESIERDIRPQFNVEVRRVQGV